MQQIDNYLDGKLVPALAGQTIHNIEPATANVFASIARSQSEDVEEAVIAAQKAFPAWRDLGAEKRANILLKIAELIEQNAEKFAQAESQDTGKPLWLARQMDIPRASQNIRFYATAALHWANHSYQQIGAINYTTRQPLGVVACISPWNLPLYLFTWKIAPALASGNCVIAKPSELTPLTAYLFAKICIEAGLPAGVLNILNGYGNEVGQAMVAHKAIKAISFTGGSKTGALIASVAAPMFKKLSLELGGKNPTIIFASADYEKALETALKASFLNQGEICLCGSRVLVERPIYEQFKNDLVKRINELKVGDPQNQETFLGALVSENHLDKVLSYIELAQQEGGKILTGGKRIQAEGRCEKGFFVAPTLIEGLDFNCRTNQEEIFGPVSTIQAFDTEQEALLYANSVQYGLACSIWTNDLAQAHRVAEHIESGIVWVNCWLLRDLRTPFGGVKSSGVGREGGFDALNFFTEEKNICIKYA
ncbi:MAG: aldehyde dehydrogenase [Thermonemataceae bacterium]|nr:aldehyde dehydrogenase [Thermonemataceae bacterium]